MSVYKTWRPLFASGSVGWAAITGWQPDSRWRADQEVLAISFVPPSGKELMACVITEPLAVKELTWQPVHEGAMRIINEFTGESTDYSAGEVRAGIAISASAADGHLFSALPI
jgi:hypothetical protein